MSDCDNLTAHVIIETVNRVGVDEAVSNPQSSLNDFLNLSNVLQKYTTQYELASEPIT